MPGEQEKEAMSGSSTTDLFTRFALELYRRAGVAEACLDLQNRHDLDVNVVLFAAFVGAVRRQTLTTADLDLAHRRVDAWHHEVVRPLRAVRQRLTTGPAPAPNEATRPLTAKKVRGYGFRPPRGGRFGGRAGRAAAIPPGGKKRPDQLLWWGGWPGPVVRLPVGCRRRVVGRAGLVSGDLVVADGVCP
jgi:uncharacterized protein (TIGR02444 family)